MADDDLFETEAPAESNAPAETPTPPPMTPEDISAAIQEATARGNQPIVQALQGIQERVAAMERARVEPATPPAPAKPDEKLDAFLADPDAFIGERASKEGRKVLERLAPILKLQLDQTRGSLVRDSKSAFEHEFGDGAWDEIKAKVDEQLDRLPLEMQASQTHVEAAVSMALGSVMMTPEGRTKMAEKRDAMEKARRTGGSPPMLTGPGRTRPTGVEVSSDEKAFVGALQKSGFDYTLKDYVAARSVGNTEEAWAAHFEKRDAEAKRAGGR